MLGAKPRSWSPAPTPRATLAQSPEQMEYERQQREYWQALRGQ
jgi:hypothetical protein